MRSTNSLKHILKICLFCNNPWSVVRLKLRKMRIGILTFKIYVMSFSVFLNRFSKIIGNITFVSQLKLQTVLRDKHSKRIRIIICIHYDVQWTKSFITDIKSKGYTFTKFTHYTAISCLTIRKLNCKYVRIIQFLPQLVASVLKWRFQQFIRYFTGFGFKAWNICLWKGNIIIFVIIIIIVVIIIIFIITRILLRCLTNSTNNNRFRCVLIKYTKHLTLKAPLITVIKKKFKSLSFGKPQLWQLYLIWHKAVLRCTGCYMR